MTEVEAAVPVWRQAFVLPSWQPTAVANQTVLAPHSRGLGLMTEPVGLRSLKAGKFITSAYQRGAKGVGNG